MIAKVTKEFAKFTLGGEIQDDLVYVWGDQFNIAAHEVAVIDTKKLNREAPSEVVKLQLRHGFAQALESETRRFFWEVQRSFSAVFHPCRCQSSYSFAH